jgi:hypothetical protein
VSAPGRLHPMRGLIAATRRSGPRATRRHSVRVLSDTSQVSHRPRTDRRPETEGSMRRRVASSAENDRPQIDALQRQPWRADRRSGGASVVSRVGSTEDYGCGRRRRLGRSNKTEGRQKSLCKENLLDGLSPCLGPVRGASKDTVLGSVTKLGLRATRSRAASRRGESSDGRVRHNSRHVAAIGCSC